MRKSLVLLIMALGVGLFAQDVKNTSLIIFQKSIDVKFVVVKDEVFINWSDLMTALPGWFFVNQSGQIEVSQVLQLAVLRAISDSYTSTTNPSTIGDVIESNIDGEFSGWDGETIFKLTNGQIWQQSQYAYTYHYAYRPRVTIINSNRGYLMQVDGVSGTIYVKRLK